MEVWLPVGYRPRAEALIVVMLKRQCNHALALSLSKAGRGLQACFDKLSKIALKVLISLMF